MTDADAQDWTAIAAALGFATETILPDVHAIGRARTSSEILRYVAGGLIAGGGGVVLAMLIGGTALDWRSYVALDAVYGVLLLAQAVFSWRMLISMRTAPVLVNMCLPGIGILGLVLASAIHSSAQQSVVQAYTSDWWVLVGTALLASLLGCQKRFHADHQMQVLAKYEELRKRWDEQQKQIAATVKAAGLAQDSAAKHTDRA